jgi:glycosyltransferase involved in cell wall biosynthesis
MMENEQGDHSSTTAPALRRAELRLSVIVPTFNERNNVAPLAARLTKALDGVGLRWSVLFVDDGSRDDTLVEIRALSSRDARFGALALSRNFGKEACIAAGLGAATGDAVIIIDADLQHPPESIPSFIDAWLAGNSIVFGTRENRAGDGALRQFMSRVFYRLFHFVSETQIPDDVTDFILLDRKAVAALNSLGERSRFTKGLYAWIGFRSTSVSFPVAERQHDRSSFNLIKLGRFAIDGVTSFSSLPLKIWSYLGLVISVIAIAYALVFLVQTLVLGVDVPGFPSLIISIMLLSGIQLISLGVIGEYIARVFNEVKARPLFVVAERIGVPEAMPGAPAQSKIPDRPGDVA